MIIDYGLAAIAVLFILVYLLCALVRPERF